VDKYDEKARTLCRAATPKNVSRIEHIEPEDPCPVCATIAAALRESAAEAFEEAAKRAARSISDGSESVEELPNELEVKAAMLRAAAPPRAAGERNKI
jgi:hypothetical protein